MSNIDTNLTPAQSNQLEDIIQRLQKQNNLPVNTKVTNNNPIIKPISTPQDNNNINLEQAKVMPAPQMSINDAALFIQNINNNINKIVQDVQPQIEAVKLNNIVNERASREPLPASTAQAFDNGDIIVNTSIGPVNVRKVVMIDNVIFKITNSPIYKAILGDIKEEELNKAIIDGDNMLDIIYQFTHNAKEVKKLASLGYDKYHAAAEEKGYEYNQADGQLLISTILGLNQDANNARTSVEAPPSNENDTEVDEDKKK